LAKEKTFFVCQECGRKAPKPLGRCPQCGSWNSMVQEVVTPRRGRRARTPTSEVRARRLPEIKGDPEARLQLPIEEFARVLGGGVMPGSVVLIGGDPGIGKSTLLLQTAMALSRTGEVLYVSGEESERQIKGRTQRLSSGPFAEENVHLLTETNLDVILEQIGRIKPNLVVVDSIQTTYSSDLDSSPGSISQVRECAQQLQSLAKATATAIFLVGHVTKEGAIAGPRVLEHIVDTVLYLEGDAFHAYRLLRSVKNRFGPTTEVGVFEMTAQGMAEVSNPSEAFLAERVINAPGSAIAVTMEGTRPLLIEIQGLTSTTSFGNPRRTANGVDFNRLLLTIAVLTRRVGLRLADQDVFVNVVGGLRVDEPAADLAVATAIASSVRDQPLRADLCLIGEVGLSGELRTVAQLPARLHEAAKLGFKDIILPRGIRSEVQAPDALNLHSARSLHQALELALDSTGAGT
jgi:DNA repair protein RadA/Sms